VDAKKRSRPPHRRFRAKSFAVTVRPTPMALPRRTILIADEDSAVTTLLASQLEWHGFQTCCVGTAQAMVQVLGQRQVDLVVMESRLPDVDGFALMQQLQRHWGIPVIILSTHSQTFDRIIGLESGADDYLGKPFEPREVVARVRAVLRARPTQTLLPVYPATKPRQASGALAAHWRIDRSNNCLHGGEGDTVALSPMECRLLEAFLHAPDSLLTREQLRWLVHGKATRVGERNIDLLVARLRQKLAHFPNGSTAIRTVRGKGYLLRTHLRDAE
jgi:two-component system OmpR family response regulator